LNHFKQVLLEDDGDDLDDSNKEHIIHHLPCLKRWLILSGC